MANHRKLILIYLCSSVLTCGQFLLCSAAHADDTKRKAAVFPIGGTASQEQRDKVGFSLRAKLDRDGYYEPIDGPTMAEMVGDRMIMLSAKPDELIAIAKDESPAILIWGELNATGKTFELKIKTLNVGETNKAPIESDETISQPNDLRFAIERILQGVRGIKKFNHPIENAVTEDAESERLWKENPNLVTDSAFNDPNAWTALLRSEKYLPPLSKTLPNADKVVIYEHDNHNVLAMNLSKDVAESNGLACVSAPIVIEPKKRYRLEFKYQSDHPTLHVFVKGYVKKPDISGQVADLQCYECQVPPSGPTQGNWKSVTCDINPQNPTNSPTFLKIDLYAYLAAGRVEFDDIQLRAVGELTRHAVDDALKSPTTKR